jgi:hypothetical protein
MSLLHSVNKLTLITNGDSWTFGSEIVSPELVNANPDATHVCQYDFYENNDAYRVPRTYPSYLAEKLNANVVNLAWPADDNGSILRRTIDYITTNYIAANKSTEDLFVVVGWSSPERNSFWFKDDNTSEPFRLWPNVPNFTHTAQEKFWELYVAYLWNPEEYLPRFILNCIQLDNFCRSHNIKFLQFNAFYQTPNSNIDTWQELNIKEELGKLKLSGYQYTDSDSKVRQHNLFDYAATWSNVRNFYKKDQPNSTFKSFIDNAGLDNPYCTIGQGAGWHPSPEAHAAWAQELHKYIQENNLL